MKEKTRKYACLSADKNARRYILRPKNVMKWQTKKTLPPTQNTMIAWNRFSLISTVKVTLNSAGTHLVWFGKSSDVITMQQFIKNEFEKQRFKCYDQK